MSSGVVARILKLQRPAPNDWVIIGAHRFGRELANAIQKTDDHSVILLDTNPSHVKMAKKYGLTALLYDAMEAEELYEEEQTLFGAWLYLRHLRTTVNSTNSCNAGRSNSSRFSLWVDSQRQSKHP